MKKKLLSLVLAGAMVASTSVSAFAATTANTKEVTTDGGTANVEITGNIAKTSDGSILPGTISVSVPTATNFVVDKNGVLKGSTINVTNTGEESVDVYAYEFIDKTRETGITVKRSVDSSSARSEITLYLNGGEGNAYFSSSADITRGIYANDKDNSGFVGSDGIKVASLSTGEKAELRLEGQGGTSETQLPEALKEDFTLKLKIKKKATD